MFDFDLHRNIVANPEPDLILKVRNDGVQCTRIVWQRNTQFKYVLFFVLIFDETIFNIPSITYTCSTICGGFTDGAIAFWNISTTSSILKKGKEIYPFRTFEAHNSSITGMLIFIAKVRERSLANVLVF